MTEINVTKLFADENELFFIQILHALKLSRRNIINSLYTYCVWISKLVCCRRWYNV